MEGHNLKVSVFATYFKNVSASFTLELKSPLCLQERMFHKVVPLYAMELRMMLVLKVTRGFAPLQVRPLRVRPHYDQFAPHAVLCMILLMLKLSLDLALFTTFNSASYLTANRKISTETNFHAN